MLRAIAISILRLALLYAFVAVYGCVMVSLYSNIYDLTVYSTLGGFAFGTILSDWRF